MGASESLYSFVRSALTGITDEPEKVKIEIVISGTRTVTLIISCAANDLKFVHSKFKSIKHIAIGIAQRHKTIVNLVMND